MIGTTRIWAALGLLVVTALACVLVGVKAYQIGQEKGRAGVKQQWDAERAAVAKAQAEEMMKARQREQALIDLQTKLRQEHKREVDRITRRYAADLERLRNRPEARAGAGGVPESAAAGVGCTGEGLSRGDAAFLAGYAADAARTQAALQWCVAQYNEVREQINGRTQD